MTALRPLTGLRAGISIAASNDLADRGFTEAGMNRLTVRFTRALLDQGATLAFGHDWRQMGIMDAVCRAALDSFGFPGDRDPNPRILNLVSWPDETTVGREVLDRLDGILEVREAGLPEEARRRIPAHLTEASDPDLWRYTRSRGLTYLRRRLTAVSQARICLGGKERNFSGRYPGILEEALFALNAGQPLYLVGLLGGAAASVGRAVLDGAEMPPGFGRDVFGEPEKGGSPLAQLYERFAQTYPSADSFRTPPPLRDEVLDLEGAWSLARGVGTEWPGSGNGLSEKDNRRLLETHLEDEALHLVLTGLRALREREGEAGDS